MAQIKTARNLRTFLQVLSFAALPNIASAANPIITLQVSSEQHPGGYAQFKLYLTQPARISSSGMSIQFDPSIFAALGTGVCVSSLSASLGGKAC
jgi:hypothetical protein